MLQQYTPQQGGGGEFISRAFPRRIAQCWQSRLLSRSTLPSPNVTPCDVWTHQVPPPSQKHVRFRHMCQSQRKLPVSGATRVTKEEDNLQARTQFSHTHTLPCASSPQAFSPPRSRPAVPHLPETLFLPLPVPLPLPRRPVLLLLLRLRWYQRRLSRRERPSWSCLPSAVMG